MNTRRKFIETVGKLAAVAVVAPELVATAKPVMEEELLCVPERLNIAWWETERYALCVSREYSTGIGFIIRTRPSLRDP